MVKNSALINTNILLIQFFRINMETTARLLTVFWLINISILLGFIQTLQKVIQCLVISSTAITWSVPRAQKGNKKSHNKRRKLPYQWNIREIRIRL